MYCLCVNVYCHRVTTQLQLTKIYQIENFLPMLPLLFSPSDSRTYVLPGRKFFQSSYVRNLDAPYHNLIYWPFINGVGGRVIGK